MWIFSVLTFRDVKGGKGGAGGCAGNAPWSMHLCVLLLSSVRQLRSWRRSLRWQNTESLLPLSICLGCILFRAGVRTGGATWALRAIWRWGRSGPAQAAWDLVFGARWRGRLGAAVLFWRVRGQRLQAAHGCAAGTAAECVTCHKKRDGMGLNLLKAKLKNNVKVKMLHSEKEVLYSTSPYICWFYLFSYLRL